MELQRSPAPAGTVRLDASPRSKSQHRTLPIWLMLTIWACSLALAVSLCTGLPGIIVGRSMSSDIAASMRAHMLSDSIAAFRAVVDEGIRNIRHLGRLAETPYNFSTIVPTFARYPNETSGLVPYDMPGRFLELAPLFPHVETMGWRCFHNDSYTTTMTLNKFQYGRWVVGWQDFRTPATIFYYDLDTDATTWGPDKLQSAITSYVYNTWDKMGEVVKQPRAYPSQIAHTSLLGTLMAIVSPSPWGSVWTRFSLVRTQTMEEELRKIDKTPNSRIVVIDETGYLAGTSMLGVSVWKNESTGQRFHILDIEDPIVSVASRELKDRCNNSWSQLESGSAFKINGVLVDVYTWRHNENSTTFAVIIMVLESDFTADSQRLVAILIAIVPTSTAIAVVIAVLFSWAIVHPIRAMSRKISNISRLEFESEGTTRKYFLKEVDELQKSYMEMKTGMISFSKYIPSKLCKIVVEENRAAVLGVQPTEIAVFFADVENFTPLTEKEDPNKLFTSLGECFDTFTRIIQNNQGTVDKFIGDAIMAFWNEPTKVVNYSLHAIQTIFECLEALEKLREKWGAEGNPQFFVKFGASNGVALVGNVGATDRFNYTIIGKTVNEAARLEPITRLFKVSCVISEPMAKSLSADVLFRELRTVKLKGMETPRKVFEPICMLQLATPEQLEMVASYEQALQTFNSGDYIHAHEMLSKHIEKYPRDMAALVLMDDCMKTPSNSSVKDTSPTNLNNTW